MGNHIDKSRWPTNTTEAIEKAKVFLRLFRDTVGDESGEVSATVAKLSNERVFTESEVRALLKPLEDVVNIGGVAVIETGSDHRIDKWVKALNLLRTSLYSVGIRSLNPA